MNKNGTSAKEQAFATLKTIIFIILYCEWEINGQPVCSGVRYEQGCSCKSMEGKKEGGKEGGEEGNGQDI